MFVSELAKVTATTKDTIRHYHQLGLLIVNKRTAGTRFYYDYPSENIDRIKNIKQGKTLGFTLREIAFLLEAYYSGELSTQRQRQILNDQLLAIEQKVQELNNIKASIKSKLSSVTYKS